MAGRLSSPSVQNRPGQICPEIAPVPEEIGKKIDVEGLPCIQDDSPQLLDQERAHQVTQAVLIAETDGTPEDQENGIRPGA